jgi:hypothetical protein
VSFLSLIIVILRNCKIQMVLHIPRSQTSHKLHSVAMRYSAETFRLHHMNSLAQSPIVSICMRLSFMASYWKAPLCQLLLNDLPSTNTLMLIDWGDSLCVDTDVRNIHQLFLLLKSIDKFAGFGRLNKVGEEAFDSLGWHDGSIWYPQSGQLHRTLHYLEQS